MAVLKLRQFYPA